MKAIGLIGMRYGRLLVLGADASVINKKHPRYLCKCDCGNIKSVAADHLRDGHTKSCGCFKSETCIVNLPKKFTTTTHGMSKTRLYQIYEGMLQRCYNSKKPFYHSYGGRGIRVSEKWRKSPASFLEWSLFNGYSEDLSIDRIDTNGNYEPSNCRWADSKTQMRNRRNTWKVSYREQIRAVAEWCELLGLKYGTISNRLRRGVCVEDAFEHKEVIE